MSFFSIQTLFGASLPIVLAAVDVIVFVTFEKEYVSKFPAKNCFQIVSYKNVSFT